MARARAVALAMCVALAPRATASDVAITTIDAFVERAVTQERYDAVVVAFTRAGCPHCDALEPHLARLRDEFATRKGTVDVFAVACDETSAALCAWQRATRFPTIKYYVAGDGDELGREYGTTRAATYDAMATFVEHRLERAET